MKVTDLTLLEIKLIEELVKVKYQEIRKPWTIEAITYGQLTNTFLIKIQDAKNKVYYVQL